MKPIFTPTYTMPVTVCAVCDGRYDDPAGYISHLSTCAPQRLPQITDALRGLLNTPRRYNDEH